MFKIQHAVKSMKVLNTQTNEQNERQRSDSLWRRYLDSFAVFMAFLQARKECPFGFSFPSFFLSHSYFSPLYPNQLFIKAASLSSEIQIHFI